MKRETIQAIVNVAKAVRDDDSRYHLAHVCMDRNNDKIRLRATDGHMMAIVHVDDPELANLVLDKTYAISPENVDLLKLILRSYSKYDFDAAKIQSSYEVSSVGKTQDFIVSRMGISCEIKTAKNAEIKFPDFDSLLPAVVPEPFSIGLNPRLLLQLSEAMQGSNKSKLVKLSFTGPLAPMIVETMDKQMGILMPARVEP